MYYISNELGDIAIYTFLVICTVSFVAAAKVTSDIYLRVASFIENQSTENVIYKSDLAEAGTTSSMIQNYVTKLGLPISVLFFSINAFYSFTESTGNDDVIVVILIFAIFLIILSTPTIITATLGYSLIYLYRIFRYLKSKKLSPSNREIGHKNDQSGN